MIHHRININHRDKKVTHSISTGRKLVTVRRFITLLHDHNFMLHVQFQKLSVYVHFLGPLLCRSSSWWKQVSLFNPFIVFIVPVHSNCLFIAGWRCLWQRYAHGWFCSVRKLGSLNGWERGHHQSNEYWNYFRTISMETLGKLLGDWMECIWPFPSAYISYWTKLNWHQLHMTYTDALLN